MIARSSRGPARLLLAALLGIALLAAAAMAVGWRSGPEPLRERPPAERPALMLLTSLPLVFGEQFGLDSGGSETLRALETRYRVEPIAIADAATLANKRLLLMAHPRAQTAEALVDLDKWVRGGGRLLLLADPRLEWPSDLPLGHIHRPPPDFADTGLLAHWGLRLDSPEEPGPVQAEVGDRRVELRSPGTLAGNCALAKSGLVARCTIGEGKATIIADADFLQPEGASESQVETNLQFLLAELAALER